MSEIQLINDPEWKNWEKHGFTSDYVMMEGSNPRIVKPMSTAEAMLERGFLPKGTKVRWNNRGGYDFERKQAASILNESSVYTVKSCNIGSSSSTYELEEVSGRWNTVMFDKISD
jgi:hypothetical protein